MELTLSHKKHQNQKFFYFFTLREMRKCDFKLYSVSSIKGLFWFLDRHQDGVYESMATYLQARLGAACMKVNAQIVILNAHTLAKRGMVGGNAVD